MTDFTVESGIRIPDREKREAKRDLEQSIGDVTIDVDATQGGPGGGGSAASLAGGAGALDELSDQTDLLTDIHQELEKIGVSGGGGSGGGGSLFGGTSGVAIGSMLGGGGGLLGTVLGKGKSGLGSLLKGRGSIKGLIGRSPFTILSQTAGERNVGPRSGGAGGPVTSVMGDIATGEFQLKEDFWPNLKPPDNFWNVDLSPPNDLWGIDLSPPNDLWGVDLSPPDNLWGVDLSPPGDLWPDLNAPSQGFWSFLNPNSGGNGRIEEGTQDAPGQTTVGPTSNFDGFGGPVELPDNNEVPDYVSEMSPAEKQQWAMNNNPSSQATSTASTGQAPRVDVVVQEVAARIESGRTLEEALRAELENVTPEIKDEVVAQIRDDMPNRL
ncbi:hypothetical protein [Halobacterium sp. KA-6]|uniref:hypothetical protein n=1 Tax=Halobacterium sp. KA-6 TaxID=2896368 RepID=UPI001E28A615|nr:hypothetical protein [Halobacterium sp. KA-6]MCD2204408.1 hypothetical protein [Halobacterium sp. KA-6]